jgi:hypothetical protein
MIFELGTCIQPSSFGVEKIIFNIISFFVGMYGKGPEDLNEKQIEIYSLIN